MDDVRVEILTRDEVESRCREISIEVGDMDKFRRRGEAFELDADELVLYDELLGLEFLLGEKYR